MSEQHPYNIRPDQAWIRMKNILDHEMPVNQHRRRMVFVWRFFLGAMVTLVIGAGLYMIVGQSPASAPHSISEDRNHVQGLQQPVTKEKNVIPPPGTSTAESRSFNVIHADAKGTSRSNPQAEKGQSLQTFKPAPTESKRLPAKAVPEPMAQVFPSTEGPKGKSGTLQIGGTGPVVQVDQTHISNQDLVFDEQALAVDLQSRDAVVVDPLPSVALRWPSSPDAVLPTIAAKASVAKRNQFSIRPYLALEGLAGYEGGMGGQAGAGLSMKVARKLTVHTGASYRSFAPYASFFSGTVSRDLTSNTEASAILNTDLNYQGYEAYLDGEAIIAGAGYSAISPFVDRVKQWQLGAGLKWQFSRRMFVEGGVMYAWNTSVDSEYPIIEGDPFVSSPLDRISSSFNSYDLVRTSMTSWYAGVGYRIGKHLDIQMKWTQGLDPYLQPSPEQGGVDVGNARRTDVIRGLGLGVRYTL